MVEFFNVTIDEIEAVVSEFGLSMQLSQLAEAREYRESVSIRNAKNNVLADKIIEEQLSRFPEFI